MSGPDAQPGLLCLGASAGGLRSLEAVLSKLPASYPWPVLVTQHLQREHASQMPEILGRATKLPVREATDGVSPIPGTVYTCPSDGELGVSPEGHLTLRAPVTGRPQRIDHLFSTASFAKPNLVVAVILSGTGNDGTAGSLVVKLNGGTVLAESDESAQQTAMPRAARTAGTVDATLPAEAIAVLAIELAQGGQEEMTQATMRDVAQIADTLAQSSGTDFTRYRAATLRRRIEKRRALVGAESTQAYHAILRRDEAERAALIKSLLLPVTEFFRDPPAWEALEREVAPSLAARARSGGTIHVWCAGCASGEEAYSMAILLAEAGVPLDRIRVLGTDLDPDSIELATRGTFDASRMQNVTAARRARFFNVEDGAFRVTDELRSAVSFRAHDVTHEAPFGGPFDIIACRNVLIYFDESLQQQVIRTFEHRMAPDGVLFLGRSTTLPPGSEGFEQVGRSVRIFRRRPNALAPERPAAPHAARAVPTRVSPARARPGEAPAIDAIMMEDSSAIILVVDGAWAITLANRRARDVLGADLAGKSLLDVFPRWQGSPVHDALRTVMGTGRSVRVQGVPLSDGYVDLTLETLPDGGERKLFLVATPAEPKRAFAKASREDQQVLKEDLAATNDELQAANEELAAANEELQATNEELASLNEEFLSTNQNLAASNAEMLAVAADGRVAGDLLQAFLHSRGEVAIACDASRIVTLVTPRAVVLFPTAAAVGRPLDAGALGIEAATLERWLDGSHRASSRIEEDVSRADGEFRVTVEALRSTQGATLGWLLTWRPAAPRPRVDP